MVLRKKKREWNPPKWKDLRDIILFFSGLTGVYHQTFEAPSADPSLLVLFAAMMGLPAFLRQDERGRGSGQESDSQDKTSNGK